MSDRVYPPERLDEAPGHRRSRDLALASYAAMDLSSRTMGSIRSIRQFIRGELDNLPQRRPLRVLDLGAGTCDIAEAIARWAREAGHPIQFTCVDLNAHAIQLARNRLAAQPDLMIDARCESVEKHRPQRPYDCAFGSLFFHHYTNYQIVQLIKHLRAIVRNSLFINDLRRSSPAFMGLLPVGPFLPAGVWHDAMMSIRRGFRPDTLGALLRRLPRVSVKTQHEMFFRVTAEVSFLA